MKMLKLNKSIDLNAPKEKVWQVLLEDKYNRVWYAAFSEGTHAVTDWKVGSKVAFLDKNKDGLVGKVVVNKPNEMLSVEYLGEVVKGQEDYTSANAQHVKGGLETYYLSEKDGVTHFAVEGDMSEEYFDIMARAWDRALQKIKELSE